jgi:hypothetical protein
MRNAYQIQDSLTEQDAVQILGAVYFFLRERDVCRTLAEMHANCAAQGTVLSLRAECMKSGYGLYR